MTCPRCGTAVPPPATQCPACAARVEDPYATFIQANPLFDDAMTMAPRPVAPAGMAAAGYGAGVDAGSDTTAATSTALPASSPVANPDGPLRPGQPFGPRYHIIRPLGSGGMGAVYHAWDTELGEAVAIKVIRPEVMADPSAAAAIERRFKRELLLARQVTHKNVVRIHDLGDIDGIKYITMSYVDGVDLSTLLKQEGTLGVKRALEVTRGIVSGLLAAHAAGVVHRDLKPANIMIRKDGEALIMDFGIARSTGGPPELTEAVATIPIDVRAAATRWAEATAAGAIVGTVQYMAPEQARGEDVDQRADIYALGLIMYDMMAGRHRSTHAASAIAELQARMKGSPDPIQKIVPAVPTSLGDLVGRCLEPDREKRFPTTEALSQALAGLDESGALLPVRRVVGMPVLVAIVVALLGVGAGLVYYQRQFIPPAAHDPVSVLIADLDNQTGNASFDRTLEPMLKRALEGAGFVTAYDRNSLRGLGVKPRETLDATGAHELAVQQGLGVVLSGAIARQGSGYRISLTAKQTVADTEIVSADARAAGDDQVLDTVTRLVTRVRNALGDESSESTQQFAMGSLSATSLDVVRYYARAMEAQSGNRFDEARLNASKAVELDPKFGIGYLILAIVSRNLGRLDDNQKYMQEALKHLDGMTERERYQTRGYSYWATGDYEQCVKEFGDLIARYPSDIGGRNQLALCLSNLRQMRRAMDEVREVVKILPSHPLFRDNLALYANYAGDFMTAEQEARAVAGDDAYARLALAFSQTGQGQIGQARETYEQLRTMGAVGASMAASGLGDLAAAEGRFAEAVRLLREGADADLAAMNSDAAAAKLVALAHAELERGRPRQAIAAADDALKRSTAVKVRFLAGRIFIEGGAPAKATPILEGLAKEFTAEPRAYGRILEGLTALQAGDARNAMAILREANGLFSTWIGQLDLGRASLAAGAFIQADSAFDVCLNARRGEALAIFVDEEPTWAYLPQAWFFQAQVRQGMQSSGAAESYRQYLVFRGASTDDPRVTEARARLKALGAS